MLDDVTIKSMISTIGFIPVSYRVLCRPGSQADIVLITVDEEYLSKVFEDERIMTYLEKHMTIVFAFTTREVAKKFRYLHNKYQKAHPAVPTLQ